MCYSQSYDDAPVYRVSVLVPFAKVPELPRALNRYARPDLASAKEAVYDLGSVQAWSQREALRLASERFNIPAGATSIRVSSYTETESPLVEPLDPAERRRPVKRARG